ncbi:MAG: hypothetical protein ACKO0Z_25125 [Betaproteobacteria bacterium]
MADIALTGNGGATFAGARGVDAFRIQTLINGLNGYVKFNMIPTRGVTITRMLNMASDYTGKRYKRGEGLKAASDLAELLKGRLESGHTTVKDNG